MSDTQPTPSQNQIVVVNDTSMQLHIQASLLRKDGFETTTFKSAEDALRSMGHPRPPDLIVTDLYMPGIDGWRFCRLLRSPEYVEFNKVPILVVSATFAGEDAKRMSRQTGADAFLPSPVDKESFVATVRSLLREGGGSNDHRALIVEDTKTSSKIMTLAFEENGYVVDAALTLEQANNALSENDYTIALLDYHLPDGHGDELLERLQTEQPACVVIMMTTDPNPDLALSWMKRGAAAYARKPFKMDYIFELCAQAARERALLRVEDLLEERTRQLRESEREYRELTEDIPVGLYKMSLDGTISYANQACFDLCRWPESERDAWFAQGVLKSYVNPDDELELRRRLFKDGRVEGFEAPMRRHDGGVVWLSNTAHLVKNSETGEQFISGSFIDVSKRKQAEDRLREAMTKANAANQAKSEFLANMSHEIRTPMNGILGMSELLLDTELDDEQREMLDIVVTASNSLLDIINDVLSLSRIERDKVTLKKTTFNLRDVVDIVKNTLRLETAKHGIDFEVEYNAPLGIIGDAVAIRQILLNLAGNAVKFTHSGSVTVAVDLTEGEAQNANLKLRVADTGIGIAKDDSDKIFEPFSQADGSMTRKYGGTGLGLTIVKRLVALMEGTLDMESSVGRGTTFTVNLPVKIPETRVVPAPEKIVEIKRFALKALVVDDIDSNRFLAMKALDKMGCSVDGAKDGDTALKMLREKHYDVVFMDVRMPGMDGFATTRAIRGDATDENEKLPIIAITAHALEGDREKCLKAGMDDYIAKPFTLDDLAKILEKWFPHHPNRSTSETIVSNEE